MVAGSSLLAAPFQNRLTEHLRQYFKDTLHDVLAAAYSAGYAPGTEPPTGGDDEVAAGMARMQQLMTRPQTWTTREQKFVRKWLTAWSKRNGTRS